MRILFFFLLGSVVLMQPLFSQKWVDMMESGTANFYDIQKEFESYWQGKTIQRGHGWKQFKRWEYFMEPRVYPTGKIPPPDITAQALEEYQNTLGAAWTDNAQWQSLGPASWQTISYNPGIGRVNGFAVDPNDPNIIYAGAPSGGLWKSTDGGSTWQTTTDQLKVLGVTSIAIDPQNTNVVYIGTGDGDAGDTYSVGVLKSTDGGITWSETGLQWAVTETKRISKLLIHPQNSSILLAATNNGVYKSVDAGINWTNVLSGNFKDIEFKPGDPNVVYVAGREFYRSTDGGDTFTQVTNGIQQSIRIGRLAIAVTSANPNYVYMVAADIVTSGFLALYRSTDSGQSFSVRSTSPNILGYEIDGSDTGGQGWYDLAIAAAPDNADEIFVGGVNIWHSLDGGTNWALNGYWYYFNNDYPYVHADIHTMEFHNNTLFAGCDGGLWITDDKGVNWYDITFGMVTTQFYRISSYPANENLILGGAQDNGTFRWENNVWTHVYGSDGMETAINFRNPDTMYASYYNGGLMRSIDHGNTFTEIGHSIVESGAWVTPYSLNPFNPQSILAGFENVWKSVDGGDSWSKISQFTGGNTIRSLAISPLDSNLIYVATQTNIFRTTDGGQNWVDITGTLPTDQASLTYIALANNNSQQVWVTFSGYVDSIKVFTSNDQGNTWQNISGTLPNVPVNCIAFENGSTQNAIYIGTDVGVYYRDDVYGDWQPFNNGLPNVIINELEIHENSQLLYAASYGRGLWKTPIQAVISSTEKPTAPIVKTMDLSPNFPNPFNPSTHFLVTLNKKQNINVAIFNSSGQKVRQIYSGTLPGGTYRFEWNGKNDEGTSLSSGVYFYRLTTSERSITRKMILIR